MCATRDDPDDCNTLLLLLLVYPTTLYFLFSCAGSSSLSVSSTDVLHAAIGGEDRPSRETIGSRRPESPPESPARKGETDGR